MIIKKYNSIFFVKIMIFLVIYILAVFSYACFYSFFNELQYGFFVAGILLATLTLYFFYNLLTSIFQRKIEVKIENNLLIITSFLRKNEIETNKIQKIEIRLSSYLNSISSYSKKSDDIEFMNFNMMDFLGINRGLNLIIFYDDQKIELKKIDARHKKQLDEFIKSFIATSTNTL